MAHVPLRGKRPPRISTISTLRLLSLFPPLSILHSSCSTADAANLAFVHVPSTRTRHHRSSPPPRRRTATSRASTNDVRSSSSSRRRAAPEGALPDIVVHSVFDFLPGVGVGDDDDVDPRVWVPQTDRLSFRPLCLCTSQGYYVNLLKFAGGGVLGRHRHSSPVHALTLRGSWGYLEHDWHARPGTYVYEPPGETHTLVVDEGCDEMIALFHVTGSLLYVSEGTGEITGYDDVFTKLEKARRWYEECGLGRDYADRLVR